MNPSLLCVSFILALISFPMEIRAKRVAKEEVKEDKKTDMNSDGTDEKLKEEVGKYNKTDKMFQKRKRRTKNLRHHLKF